MSHRRYRHRPRSAPLIPGARLPCSPVSGHAPLPRGVEATLAGAQATQAADEAGTTATSAAMQVGTIGMMAPAACSWSSACSAAS
jgi:hypothetical protein